MKDCQIYGLNCTDQKFFVVIQEEYTPQTIMQSGSTEWMYLHASDYITWLYFIEYTPHSIMYCGCTYIMWLYFIEYTPHAIMHSYYTERMYPHNFYYALWLYKKNYPQAIMQSGYTQTEYTLHALPCFVVIQNKYTLHAFNHALWLYRTNTLLIP